MIGRRVFVLSLKASEYLTAGVKCKVPFTATKIGSKDSGSKRASCDLWGPSSDADRYRVQVGCNWSLSRCAHFAERSQNRA
jgi:hypothetical protein